MRRAESAEESEETRRFARRAVAAWACTLAALTLVAPAAAEKEAPAADAETPVYDVYVTSPRDVAEEVVTVRRLDRTDFREENARSLDEALVHVPNVVVRTGGDGVPRIDVRGLRSRHLTLLVDGIPFNATSDGQFDASLVPTLLIDRIDLVTSNSSVLYGDGGIAGVLQVRTRKPTENLEGSASFDVRERGQYQPEATASGSVGGVEGFFSGRYLHSKGYQLPDSFNSTPVENGGLRNNSQREQLNLFGKLGYKVSPELRVGVLADYRRADFGVPPNVYGDSSDPFAPRTRYERVDNLEGFSTQLSGSYEPEGPLSLRSWVYANRQEEDRRRYDDDQYDTISRNGTFSIHEESLNTGGALHGRYDLEKWGNMRFATNGRYERFQSDGRVCEAGGGGGGGGGRCGSGASQTPFTRIDSDDDAGVWSLGMEYEIEPLDGLGLVVGYSHAFLEGSGGVSDDGSIFLAGASWEAPTETRLWGSVAHKIRFPSVVQLYDVESGNRKLDTERCWCFEVGVVQELPLGSSIALTGFWQELRDFIERDEDRIFDNRQKLRIRGVELSAASRPIEPVELRFAYAYLHTNDKSDDRNFPRLANRPKHTIDAEARYTHPWDGDLRAAVRWLDGLEQDSRNEPYEFKNLDAFTTVDLRIAQRFWKQRVEIYFGVDNVFDAQGEINYGFPMAGRTFLGGGSIQF